MRCSEIPRSPSPSVLRQFSALCLAFLGALSLWQGLARGNVLLCGVFAALALILGLLGIVWPRAVRWIYVGWMIAAFPLAWAVSHIMIALVYYGVLTPLAVVLRLAGRDALRRRRQPDDSYWIERQQPANVRGYFRQS